MEHENIIRRATIARNLVLARMAKIDGKVDAWEAHAAEGAFARFPRATARRKFCVAVFNSAKNGRTPLRDLAA